MRATTALLCLSLSAAVAADQSVDQDNGIQEMRQLTQQESWTQAIEIGRELVEDNPRNAEAWLLLGDSLRKLERYDEAVEAIEQAVELGFQPFRSLGSLAIAHAQAGNSDPALDALEEAIEAGLPSSILETHPGLEPLRTNPRYIDILEIAERLSHPCEHDERYRAFDFWLGDWDVFIGEQLVARNTITQLQRGCIIHESWAAASGGTGESINFYDPKSGDWRQQWVGANGGVVWYSGGPKEGAMHMVGENVDSKGQSLPARVTWTPNDDETVHHLIEHSDDNGKTWSIWFDAIYRMRDPSESEKD